MFPRKGRTVWSISSEKTGHGEHHDGHFVTPRRSRATLAYGDDELAGIHVAADRRDPHERDSSRLVVSCTVHALGAAAAEAVTFGEPIMAPACDTALARSAHIGDPT